MLQSFEDDVPAPTVRLVKQQSRRQKEPTQLMSFASSLQASAILTGSCSDNGDNDDNNSNKSNNKKKYALQLTMSYVGAGQCSDLHAQ